MSSSFTNTEAKEKPQPKYPLLKEELGNASWKVLHSYAASYPDHPTTQDKIRMRQFLAYFFNNYPCLSCREEAKQLVRSNPPKVGSRQELSRSLCEIHNAVSKRLGKEEISCNGILWHGNSSVRKGCSSCKHISHRDELMTKEVVTTKDNTIKIGKYLQDSKQAKTRIFRALCRWKDLPVPDIYHDVCPSSPETSCTTFLTDKETGKIVEKPKVYLSPYQASDRTVVHEFMHYYKMMTGDRDGALDEYAVDLKARQLIEQDFPFDKDPSLTENLKSEESSINPKGNIILNDSSTAAVVAVPSPPSPVHHQKRNSKKEVTIIEKPYSIRDWASRFPLYSSHRDRSTVSSVMSRYSKYSDRQQQEEEQNQSQHDSSRSGFLTILDPIFDPIAKMMKLDARALNECHTPEILGNVAVTLAESNLSPFGSLIASTVTAAGLIGASIFAKDMMSYGDRKLVAEIGAHFLWNGMRYVGNPLLKGDVIEDAQETGQALARMDFRSAMDIILHGTPLKSGLAMSKRRVGIQGSNNKKRLGGFMDAGGKMQPRFRPNSALDQGAITRTAGDISKKESQFTEYEPNTISVMSSPVPTTTSVESDVASRRHIGHGMGHGYSPDIEEQEEDELLGYY